MNRSSNLGLILVLIATLSLSTEGIAAKIAYQGGTSVMTALVLRYIIAALVFWAGVFILKENFHLPVRSLTFLMVFAVSTQGLTVLCLFYSFKYIPAALSILLLYIYPTVVTFLAYFFLQEPLTKNKLTALILTLAGSAIILGQPFDNLDIRGIIFAFAAAVLNSLFVIGTAKLVKNISVLVLNTYNCTALAVFYTIIGFCFNSLSLQLTTKAWLSIIEMALICTVLATAAFFHGIKMLGASRSAIISTSEPLFTGLLGYLFLNESLNSMQITGGLFIILGVLLQRDKTPGHASQG
ncbi:MAG: EamA family transporter [Desulfotomaculum sp.]|nr:EamA family transporter [Desulfotomaculum sp.]